MLICKWLGFQLCSSAIVSVGIEQGFCTFWKWDNTDFINYAKWWPVEIILSIYWVITAWSAEEPFVCITGERYQFAYVAWMSTLGYFWSLNEKRPFSRGLCILNVICESVIAISSPHWVLRVLPEIFFFGGTNRYWGTSCGGRAQVCSGQWNWISFASFLFLPVNGPFSDPGYSVMSFLLCLQRYHLIFAMPGTSTLSITVAVSERQKKE